ncbi:MAG: type VI secretion protein [Haemophilus parainfluenzae]|jgi:lytic transglycosylase catalytic|nr:MAG: type VI secretion protein [Haemophilus parainfluenzae]
MIMPFSDLANQCAPYVHQDTISSLVSTESSLNPYAIAVVRPHIPYRNPRTRKEALALIARLETINANYSVGLGQINSANFKRFGLTAADLLDPCINLQAAQKVLSECYERYGKVNKALSCYYSGNPRIGYYLEKSGTSYVQRVHTRFRQLKANPKIWIPSLASEPMAHPIKRRSTARKFLKRKNVFQIKYARF